MSGPSICRARVAESRSPSSFGARAVFFGSHLLGSEHCVRALFRGWLVRLGRPTPVSVSESLAKQLTGEDRARSLAPAGAPDGLFRIVYRFENEQLSELLNRTAHAGALSALVELSAGYRFYFAVYVREVSRFTPIYMAAIDPFRKSIVYPALLRKIAEQWNTTFGPHRLDEPHGI